MTVLKSAYDTGRNLVLGLPDGEGRLGLTIQCRPFTDNRSIYVDGQALRDALIEAFPLPGDEPLADWEKELLSGAGLKEFPKPEVVPGMVYRDSGGGLRVVLPNESWYVVDTLVFDPRDAKALPSPLGVRVGDNVRRVQKGDHSTVTTEFEVNHIDRQIGYAYPKYGLGHPVDELEVVGREVPDRLPAGTITRERDGRLSLRTESGWIDLSDGEVYEGDSMERDLVYKKDPDEVVYLP